MTTRPTPSFTVAFDADAYPGYRGVAHADVYEDRIVWWREEIGPHDYNQFPVAEQTRAEFAVHGPPVEMDDEALAALRAHLARTAE
jgi:hypothetical protein